jgi:hypothetical protein
MPRLQSGICRFSRAASAIDAVGDAAENGFYRLDACIRVEEFEWCTALKGAVWSLQPAGGFGSIAEGVVCQREDSGETNHSVGLFGGEAGAGGKTPAEGSAGDANYFGDGAAIHGELSGDGRKDVRGQALTDKRHQLGWGPDSLLEDFFAAKDFGDGRYCHGRHFSILESPNGVRR